MSENAMEKKLERLEERIDAIGERQADTRSRVDTLAQANVHAFNTVSNIVDSESAMVSRLHLIEEYLNMLKASVDYLNVALSEIAEYTRTPMSERVTAAKEGAEATIESVMKAAEMFDHPETDVE